MTFDAKTQTELRILHAEAFSPLSFDDWLRQALAAYGDRNPALPATEHPSLFLIWTRVFLVPGALATPPTIH